MPPTLGRGARRTAGAPWVVVLVVAALTAGCTAGPAPTRPEPDPFHAAFVTRNGLLSVPELWRALGRSTTAGLLRHLALAAAGRPSAWRLSPRATFDAVSAELDAVQAASLIADAGLDRSGLWTAADLRDWWRTALERDDLDQQSVIVGLAPDPHRLAVDGATLAAWRAASTGPDAVPALIATDLLALFDRSGADPAVVRPTALHFRHPRDAATYLLREAVGAHRSPDTLAPEILTIARAAVPDDDWAMSRLARAYAAVGQTGAAGSVVDAMDPRRLLDDGGVLEAPVFEGTVGSTFRMVRALAAQDRLHVIRPDVSKDLVNRARSLLGVDVSHRLAGLALINLLEPGTVTSSDAGHAVAEALRQAGVSGAASGPAQAIGWTAVVEYADALGVRVAAPTLTAGAVRAWVSAEEPQAAVSISRYLLALQRTGQLRRGHAVDRLVARVGTELRQPERTESIVLFSGALAIRTATGRPALTDRQLREQIAARDGQCLGGFGGFVRDLPATGTACDADATWFATLLAKELDR